jgi:hypothetical protein
VRRPWTWWVAWALWAFALALGAASAAFIEAVGYSVGTNQETWAARSALFVVFIGFATVGALVASRLPRNAVGWIFLGVGLLAAVSVFSGEYANYAFVEEPGLPGGYLAGWLYLWDWYPVLSLIFVLPMLFPDGRPPGPRWRVTLRALIASFVLIVIPFWFKPGPLNDSDTPPWPDNPIGIAALESAYDYLGLLAAVVSAVALLISGASAVVRFRRSRGDERQQLKWTIYALLVWVVTIPLTAITRGDVSDVFFALTVAMIPLAAAVAMFKYRLYDVDRVISRTLVYGVLTAILGAAYLGLVLAGQVLFSSFAGGSNLAIAVSTLAVAALFLPARSRVQRLVDRRFYRRRYDAQRTLDAFGSRLRQEVDLGTLAGELRDLVEETMQPAHVSLWLREGVLR